MQFAALSCSLVQLGVIWCKLVQFCSLVQIGEVGCTLVQLGADWCSSLNVVYCTLVQIDAVLCNMVQMVQLGTVAGVVWCRLVCLLNVGLLYVGADWCKLVQFGAT